MTYTERPPEPGPMKQCWSKKKYSSQALARNVARRCEELRGVPLREYFCGYCGKWHLSKNKSGAERYGV